MKICLITSAAPFRRGGDRVIAKSLQAALLGRRHSVDLLQVPTTDEPDLLLQQMTAFRLMNFDAYDRVITLRPPSHLVRHPVKVVWFIHHLRVFYDMWNTEYNGLPKDAKGRALQSIVHLADRNALSEAHRVFCNSKTVAERLRDFNAVEGEVLYPPLPESSRFQSLGYGDEIVCVCRIERHKRQHLLLEAMAKTRTNVRLRLCGTSTDPGYVERLQSFVRQERLTGRVALDLRWVSEREKVSRLRTALAAAYVPYNEDSYGYPTLEAAQARRCTLTLTDAGGVLEFVEGGVQGLVVPPEPASIASAMDALYADRARARRLGEAAYERVQTLGIGWDRVLSRLLQ